MAASEDHYPIAPARMASLRTDRNGEKEKDKKEKKGWFGKTKGE